MFYSFIILSFQNFFFINRSSDPTTWQWRWTYDATPEGDPDSRAQSCNLWMELDSKIKFMVMDIVFTKTSGIH